MACHTCAAIKTDKQIIRKMARICNISPVDGEKLMIGRMYRRGKVSIWSRTLNEESR